MQSIEDERQFVGSILYDPAGVLSLGAAAGLQEHHFSDEVPRLVWAASQQLVTAGREVDMPAVFEVLHQQGQVERIGGLKGLSDLMKEVEDSRTAAVNLKIVLECAFRRRARQLGETVVKAATGAGTEADLRRVVADVAAKLADGLALAPAPFRAVPVADLSTMVVPAPTYAWSGLFHMGTSL